MKDLSQSNPIKKISLHTLGCKLNQSETNAIQDKFKDSGYEICEFGEDVDLTLINTCTVTNSADSGSRAVIRQAMRHAPQARIIVTGCYAQISPQDIAKIPGVDLILGNSEKYKVFDYLDSLKKGKLETPLVYVNDDGLDSEVGEDGFISTTSRTRAFLKVQEGCDYFCSYCIIPFARGRARSRSYTDSIKEATELANKGFQEIVLTGINIGTYNHQDQNGKSYSLVDLLKGLQDIEGIKRIRISSIEPNTVTDELLHLIRDSKVICPHMHIPLQSGNDDQLTAMNRKYRMSEYRDLMQRFNKIIPGAALGTDVIVGFPGETAEHFANTLDFIQNSPYTYMHIFRYSERDGTAASKITEKSDPQTAKKRSQILHATARMLKTNYARLHIGQEFKVLFDQHKNGTYSGYSENYIAVQVESPTDLRKQIKTVRLNAIDEKGQGLGTLVS